MTLASDLPLRSVPTTLPTGRPLHVLEVVGNAIVGGMERCVERLVAGLARAGGFRFTVLCPSEGAFAERVRAAGAEVAVVAMPDDPPWTSIRTVTSLIEAEGVDLVHAHLPNAHVLGGLAARLAGAPSMTTIHGRQVGVLDLELHRLVDSHLSLVCRQAYYQALALGADADRVSLEPNGVDVDLFRPGERGDAGVRAPLGLPTQALLAGFVGRLSPEKAPEVFLRAVAVLLERLPQAHAVLVGEGPMKTQLRDAIRRHGLEGRAHLFGSVDDVRPVLHDLDLLVSSSDAEAMPLALMEGMASGLPVVATRVGGVPDIVEHGGTGWLVQPRDYEDLAGRMHQMLTQPELRQAMGAAARQRMERHHRLDRSLALLGDRMRAVVSAATRASANETSTSTSTSTSASASASSVAVARLPRSGGDGARRRAPRDSRLLKEQS